jgi:hypothetical protein
VPIQLFVRLGVDPDAKNLRRDVRSWPILLKNALVETVKAH